MSELWYPGTRLGRTIALASVTCVHSQVSNCYCIDMSYTSIHVHFCKDVLNYIFICCSKDLSNAMVDKPPNWLQGYLMVLWYHVPVYLWHNASFDVAGLDVFKPWRKKESLLIDSLCGDLGAS